jgi:PAS domain S-box-containing protein
MSATAHIPKAQPAAAQWWRAVFDGAEDGQLLCRADGTAVEWNAPAARLLALPANDRTGTFRLLDAVGPAVAQRLAELFARPAGPQETLAGVTLLVAGKPSLIADLQVTPLDAGHTLLTVKDASRRWRMESHVQRLITAIDATPDAFFLTDPDWRLTYVNASFQDVTGYTIEDALGRPADFLRAPGQVEKIHESLACVSAGADWIGELVNQRADGSTYPVEATIAPIRDRSGGLLGYVSSERDLSVKKQLQSELARERDFVRSILNSLESAVYTLDREFRLTHVNEAWRKFLPEHGRLMFEEAPRLGAPLLDYVADPARRHELRDLFDTVLQTGRPHEFQAVSADKRHWLVKVAPWNHEGRVMGLIYHVADQTKVHELQNQLYQAQKMETIGTLAAGVAHDFNNLLQAIQGNLSLLMLESSLPETLRPRLEQMDQAAVRAAGITQQLLSFSRSQDENLTVFDFNQIIQEASQLARRSLKGNVQLELHPAPRPVKVRMDANRASQLLLNLAVNAQDAMPDGGVLRITNAVVALTAEQAARIQQRAGVEFVRCSVADTGTGIPPEVLPRIFDAFFTTKPKGKGTGLGLSIVHSAATQAGGFLDVESEPGRGTTFHVYLPLATGALTDEAAATKPALTHGHGRVLVVDDLDLIRAFTEDFLQRAGFEVLLAGDGAEALALLEQESKPVDLVLTDFNMPGMDGLELIEKCAARWPAMKFVMASGFLEDEQRNRLEKLKARLLNKPYHMSVATDLIAEMLRQPDSDEPNASPAV